MSDLSLNSPAEAAKQSSVSPSLAPLFTSLQLGDKTIPNRIVLPALTRNRALNNVPSDLLVEYYTQRARGGFGHLVTEGIFVSVQGSEWQHLPGIVTPEQIEGWKKVTDAVHANGKTIYAQLGHAGRLCHPDAPLQKLAGTPIYAPSAIPAKGGKFRFLPGEPGYGTPVEIPDPMSIVEQFKQNAINAKQAGFDGVELHSSSGFLGSQFLDSGSNQRTDKWGGSPENRARFGLEVLKAFISVFGGNVGVKLTPGEGFADVGMPLQDTLDTFRYFISEADKLGIAYFALTRYNTMWDPRGTNHDVLLSYRPYIKNAKLILCGAVEPEEGAKLVEAGQVDAVAFGALSMANPDLGKRLRYGKELNREINWALAQIGIGEDGSQWGIGYTDYAEETY